MKSRITTLGLPAALLSVSLFAACQNTARGVFPLQVGGQCASLDVAALCPIDEAEPVYARPVPVDRLI